MLKEHFVCGYKNIKSEAYVGNSGVHGTDSPAAVTSNGAGPHNMQLFMLAADGTVLHCLPGYWEADDLIAELKLAEKLNMVWQDSSITPEQKKAMFKKMQLEHLANHSAETKERSHLQGFDALYIAHNQNNLSDCVKDSTLLASVPGAAQTKGNKKEEGLHIPAEAFKTTDEIMHERMAKRAFMSYENFDTAAFTNYGTNFYDKEENKSETARYRPDLKHADLHAITRATEAVCTNPAVCTKPPSEREKFEELVHQGKFADAWKVADAMIRQQPMKSDGYELRSAAAFGLRQYKQALSDTTRAAWLGSRDPQLFAREKQCRAFLTQ